jgi:hypothetical protein
MHVIPALGRLRQENLKFKVSLGYIHTHKKIWLSTSAWQITKRRAQGTEVCGKEPWTPVRRLLSWHQL